jgi:hypothetical protein
MNLLSASIAKLICSRITNLRSAIKRTYQVLAIILCSVFATTTSPIFAQEEGLPIALRKGNVVATIPIGAGILVTGGGAMLAEGLLQRWDSEQLIIKQWLKPDAYIPIDQVETIYHVNSAKYTRQEGITKGAVWALWIGLPAALIGKGDEDFFYVLVNGTITISFITIPIWATIGHFKGEGPVQERYPIGPGHWEIVME